ncbi:MULTISPECIES: VRR-NUC domain-containing protein [unclassified Thioalkalivibrio]|uniref:VRR-NUC domain-containing protein n=1 Tax=unclassified Thioalkalivibrio TaxID=2621013 RepID=UPI000372FBD0|nr:MULTISPECIES: VRR-NUC domain-containing protein [unclassified Thioalkalivibrio]
MTTKRKPPRHVEDDHQRALVQWASHRLLRPAPDVEPGATLGDYLYAVPNGGNRGRIEAARLKGLGVKAGVSDLKLPLARGGYAGLYLEMKKPRSAFRSPREAERAISDSQAEWRDRMIRAGYRWAIAYGWDEAREILTDYLAQPRTTLATESTA